jgi:hypothetical protein
MDTALFLGFAVAYLALFAWGAALAARGGWATPANLPLLVVAGLVYDNGVIAAGRFIGEGTLLEGLNAGRFWLHAFATPLLVVWAWHAVRRSGASWAARPWAARAAAGTAAVLVVFELATVVAGLELRPRDEYGALSYASAHPDSGPPLMVLVVAAALVAAGVVLWRRRGRVWLLAGSVLMVLGSGIPVPVDSNAVTNLFELLLLTSILATKAEQDAASAVGSGR